MIDIDEINEKIEVLKITTSLIKDGKAIPYEGRLLHEVGVFFHDIALWRMLEKKKDGHYLTPLGHVVFEAITDPRTFVWALRGLWHFGEKDIKPKYWQLQKWVAENSKDNLEISQVKRMIEAGLIYETDDHYDTTDLMNLLWNAFFED